jgi:hypothetical protein
VHIHSILCNIISFPITIYVKWDFPQIAFSLCIFLASLVFPRALYWAVITLLVHALCLLSSLIPLKLKSPLVGRGAGEIARKRLWVLSRAHQSETHSALGVDLDLDLLVECFNGYCSSLFFRRWQMEGTCKETPHVGFCFGSSRRCWYFMVAWCSRRHK